MRTVRTFSLFCSQSLETMKSISIQIEGKDYQLYYVHVNGQILTRLEKTNNEPSPFGEQMPDGENVTNLIFATMLFGKAEARWELKKLLRQMHLWFDNDFPEEGTPVFDHLCDNLRKEARKWGGWKTPVKVNEWKSYAMQRKVMKKGKIDQFVSFALEIFLPVNGLVKELRRK